VIDNPLKDVSEFAREKGYSALRDATEKVVPIAGIGQPDGTQNGNTGAEEKKIFIEFLSPSQINAYEPASGIVLVGDNHITRGSVTVIGGAPGVGKSRATVALAEAGGTGHGWFGLKIRSKFKTLIVQNENGRFRLKQEFSDLDCGQLDSFVRITPPPPYGLCFDNLQFQCQLKEQIKEFDPAIVIIDPWNAAARDERAKEYLAAFNDIRSVMPADENGPAIVIVAHTHKPQIGERASGRALLNLLAGSYVLGSVPRAVFIMQSASDDVDETHVVWTCCKNNDGELGKRSAWVRENGLFTPIHDFDWKDWDDAKKTTKLTFEIVPEIIHNTGGQISRENLVEKLKQKGVKERTAYDWISKAENNHLIKFHKGKKAFVVE
jgi:hypothetical protein